MRRQRGLHFLAILVVVALLTAFWHAPSEPQTDPSPSPSAKLPSSTNLTPELEGAYSFSDGFYGETIELKKGQFTWSNGGCTGEGVVGSGTYELEADELVLSHLKGGVSRLTVLTDRLRLKDDRYTTDFVKHIDARGQKIPGAEVRIQERKYTPPPRTPEHISRGLKLYQANCVSCHSSSDHSQKQAYKYGADPGSLYRTLAFGIDDTPMAPWSSILSTDEIWALCFYVESLQR